MRLLLLAAAAWALVPAAAAQTVLVVNTLTATSGDANPSDGRCDVDAATPGDQCTLGAALNVANNPADAPAVPVRITFALDGTPPVFEVRGHTFFRPVVLDCATQPGYATGFPQIAFQNYGSESSIFLFRGGRSTVRGCAFVHAPTSMLTFVDAGQNVVEGNTFGLNRDGSPGVGDGIVQAVNLNTGFAPAHRNRVGGTTAEQRNVFGRFGSQVSGLFGRGVLVGTDSNTVVGNWFGLNPAGTETRPGFGPAVHVYLEASHNQIGQEGAGNVVGSAHGIVIGANSPRGNAARANRIEGNLLGVLPATGAAVANAGRTGILVNAFDGGRAEETTVRRNVVGGYQSGVRVATDPVSGTLVAENRVGTTADGTAARPNVFGIVVEGGSGTRVHGNHVSGNTSAGVAVLRGSFAASPTGVVLTANVIGLDAAGAAALPNGTGVLLSSGAAGVKVGGRVDGTANLIAGNLFDGLAITSGSPGGHVVEGNAIGLNRAGTAAVPNGAAGVAVQGPSNTIGGTVQGAANVISGNARTGVSITGSAATGNTVAGNWIGLAGDGRGTVGNGQFAVQLVVAPGNVIGAPGLFGRNLVSGNSGGVYVQQSPRTVVTNNVFGLDGFFGGRHPNGGAAVTVTQSSDSRIGGLVASEGNRFLYHRSTAAVKVLGSTGVAVLSNTYDRNGSGIDLEGDGVTANDPGDADHGDNRRMNHPVIASATLNRSTGLLDVSYSVDASSAHATYPLAVQFYLADSTGVQGAYFLVTDTYTVPGVLRSAALPTGLGQEFITEGRILATATDGAGNTSEFSPSVAAVIVAADEAPVPAAFALLPPAPQPMRGDGALVVEVPRAGRVTVDVYDLLGRRVATPFAAEAVAGRLRVPLAASQWPAGVYVVRARWGDDVRALRLVVR